MLKIKSNDGADTENIIGDTELKAFYSERQWGKK